LHAVEGVVHERDFFGSLSKLAAADFPIKWDVEVIPWIS